MKQLNPSATLVFHQLLTKLNEQDHIKLTSEGFMPLSFEIIGRLNTSFGSGNAYSLMHHYVQEGDLMRDPEVCFLHMEDDPSNLFPGIYAYSYQLDSLGLYQESFVFGANGMLEINLQLQEQHADFASDWLINIKAQGFLQEP